MLQASAIQVAIWEIVREHLPPLKRAVAAMIRGARARKTRS
mgnify:CR=1 FL=1